MGFRLAFRGLHVGSTCCVILTGLALSGCGGAPSTPARFTAGTTTDDPLEGGVINDNGNDYSLSLDGATLKSVDGSDGSSLGFDRSLSESSSVAALDRITTPDGSTAEFDAERQTLSVSGNFPIVGQQNFQLDVGGSLDNVFFSSARVRNTSGLDDLTCTDVVGAVDNFCLLYEENVLTAVDDIIALALRAASDSGIPEIANGLISDLVRDFFEVITHFCDAWTELREGTAETDPVNPCDSL